MTYPPNQVAMSIAEFNVERARKQANLGFIEVRDD